MTIEANDYLQSLARQQIKRAVAEDAPPPTPDDDRAAGEPRDTHPQAAEVTPAQLAAASELAGIGRTVLPAPENLLPDTVSRLRESNRAYKEN